MDNTYYRLSQTCEAINKISRSCPTNIKPSVHNLARPIAG